MRNNEIFSRGSRDCLDVDLIHRGSNRDGDGPCRKERLGHGCQSWTNEIYVTNQANVTVIDGASNTATTVPAGKNPRAVELDPATNKVYVANFADNTVTVIDGASNMPATIGAGTSPNAIAVNSVTKL
jgi:YVTN family beta-propeller protein